MGLKDDALNKGLNDAAAKLKGFGAGVAAIGAGIAGIGLAGLGFLGAAAKSFADFGSEVHDLSARTGISAESLGELGYAAEQSGASLGDVSASILRMQRFLTQAAGGSDTANEALTKLGLTIGELQGLSPDEQFNKVGKALAGVTDNAQRSAIAMQILGRGGARLLPMLAEMDQLRDRAQQLGVVLTQDDVNAADALGDAFHDVEVATKGVWMQIGAALAPALTELATKLADGIGWVVRFIRENRPLVVLAAQIAVGLLAVGTVIAAVGVAFIALGAVIGGATTVIGAAVSALSAVIGALWLAITTPGLVVAAVVIGIAAAFLYFSGIIGQTVTIVKALFGGLADVFETTFGGIKDAIAGGNLIAAANIAWAGVKLAVLENTQTIQAIWVDFVADIKSLWIVLMDVLGNAWAAFVNKFLAQRQQMQIALGGTLAAFQQTKLAVDVLRDAMNQPWAVGSDPLKTATDLANVEEERRQGKAGIGAGVFDARTALENARADAAKALVNAQQNEIEKAAGLPGAAAKAAAAGISRGTFSAAAVGALGGGDKLSGIEEHTKKGAKHLQNIDKKMDQMQLDFEP